MTLYDSLGKDFFENLAIDFYQEVKNSPELFVFYEQSDLEVAVLNLNLFLQQYFGGPKTYQETRGHPRLRMRHNPYEITLEVANIWLECMKNALNNQNLKPEYYQVLINYFEFASKSLINTLK